MDIIILWFFYEPNNFPWLGILGAVIPVLYPATKAWIFLSTRKATEKLLHTLLVSTYFGPSLISPLLPCLQKVHDSTDLLVNYLAETISEIREPISLVETKLTSEQQMNLDKRVIFCCNSVLLNRSVLYGIRYRDGWCYTFSRALTDIVWGKLNGNNGQRLTHSIL